jgi:DNA polymerase III sliding clamp (beta) subunit (PCNA family)
MEIVVRTTDFARALRLVQTLTDRKGTLPVLGTLLIRADAKGLTITGTDMELAEFLLSRQHTSNWFGCHSGASLI